VYQDFFDNQNDALHQVAAGRQISDNIRGMEFWRELEKKHVP
jgi:hypothetical protein